MVVADPIADLLTRLRNSGKARHRFVDINLSKTSLHVMEILRQQGYIVRYLVRDEKKTNNIIRAFLKYDEGKNHVIQGIKRVSKLSSRKYVGVDELPVVMGGMGVAIVSTSKGIMTGKKAKELNVGGEVLCYVW